MKKKSETGRLLIGDIEVVGLTSEHHSNEYFTVIYIRRGTGVHSFDRQLAPYEAGDLFLVRKGEHHFFNIGEPTHFTYIKFTDDYFRSRRRLAPDEFRADEPEAVRKIREQKGPKGSKGSKILLGEPAATLFRHLIQDIVFYKEGGHEGAEMTGSPVLFHLILSLFSLVNEAAEPGRLHPAGAHPTKDEIIAYLREHIHHREQVSVKAVAAWFSISPAYFGQFFKRIFGVPFQRYLDEQRVKLVEKRIEDGGMKMSRIAKEFGFSDTSHFAKWFRKLNGVSPTDFRKDIELVDAIAATRPGFSPGNRR